MRREEEEEEGEEEEGEGVVSYKPLVRDYARHLQPAIL